MTPVRPASRADSLRVAAVAGTLRRAIARYADVRVAEADGFRPFAPSAVGGRFLPHIFGWMVHANVFEGDDPATIWAMSREGMSPDHSHDP